MLSPEGSDDYVIPVTDKGVIRIPPRLRERYLDPTVDQAIVQASGTHLRVWMWSERTNVCIEIPFDGYRAERPYIRAVNSWGVNVRKWLTPGKGVNGESEDWFDAAALDVGYGGESAREMVPASVQTFDGVMPDV